MDDFSLAHTPLPAQTREQRFVALYREYVAVIITAAATRIADEGDAEEVAAEVFAIAWRRSKEDQSILTLPWLYATLRNVVGNTYRAQFRERRRMRRVGEQSVFDSIAYEQEFEHAEVRATIAMMKPADQEILSMFYWEGLTGKEIAEILQITPQTMRTRVHRARERFAKLLEHHETREVKEP